FAYTREDGKRTGRRVAPDRQRRASAPCQSGARQAHNPFRHEAGLSKTPRHICPRPGNRTIVPESIRATGLASHVDVFAASSAKKFARRNARGGTNCGQGTSARVARQIATAEN